ncbi:MAG TPA: UDP-N-acetylmuramoyl-tripeptide--D-alanyl-D-alanine ligase [Acidimicrobiales bacterium]|jgi:UDP-N-acetylmuramoyl-tripeptide--D-alanyl-D-alanine ligase|nr:UDP-N-acetylmuramoyl-tripeptide--D-alanyl-D-alanine ligase [Acidimicrobiales bacterium]
MFAVVGTLVAVAALIPAGARWLRVSQREHYLAGSVTRFAWRWWSGGPLAPVMALVAVAAAAVSYTYPLAAIATALMAVLGPPRLSLRGRTSPLALTRRLKLLALVWLFLQAVLVVIGLLLGHAAMWAAIGVCAVPVLLDTAAAILTPVEGRLVTPFITSARKRLAQVAPTVVAITGSYGKTSTKQHVAHLVTGTRTIVASPASYNNRAGLARAINEQLTPGTEIFVAEMGTYGKGEIAELCAWCPPSIAVITAIGPVHLERFKTEDAIVAAKSEITRTADVVILNVDDLRLSALADQLTQAGGKRIIRCSASDPTADVAVIADGARLTVAMGGVVVGDFALPGSVQPSNLACAWAAASELGVAPDVALARAATMPLVPNRLAYAQAESGVWVLDDTFNSNPAGARAALASLTSLPAEGRRVVVTPGMVELGPRQFEENRAFAQAIALVASDLIIVGRTNRSALRAGASPLVPICVETREEAVGWVRSTLGPGDAVLYENDLPDHYR